MMTRHVLFDVSFLGGWNLTRKKAVIEYGLADEFGLEEQVDTASLKHQKPNCHPCFTFADSFVLVVLIYCEAC